MDKSDEPINAFIMNLIQSFQNMQKELTKKQPKLKETITSSLDYFALPEFSSIVYSNSNVNYNKTMGDIIQTIKTICDSKQPRLIILSIDCLQKIMISGSLQGTVDPENQKLIDKAVEVILSFVEFPDEGVQLQIIKTISATVTSPFCGIHEISLTNMFSKSVNLYLQSKNVAHQNAAKESLTTMLSYIFRQYEEENAAKDKIAAIPKLEESLVSEEEKNERFTIAYPAPPAHIYGDCFLIFRALCKLSMKELLPSSPSDSVDMKRKLLSLELLQYIIDEAGPALKSSDRFISQAIKKYLVISILNNGITPFPKVFRLSLNIFNGLLSNFKDYLRNEIGIFFSKIVLRILASNNSAIQQKHAVLKFLLIVCKNAQTIVDIFLNYDCHLESEDLFESMVNHLSSIAKGFSTDSNTTPQENEICLLSLECLVTIMKSQVVWSSELAEEVQSTDSENDLKSSDAENGKEKAQTPAAPDDDEITDNSVSQFAKIKLKKQKLEHGKKLFNYTPKKGIKYLIESGCLENSSLAVAKFLFQEEGLDKSQVGAYLGEISNPFSFSVLYDFVDIQQFSNQSIDVALRNFLSTFRLPGESQKIDKIMEKFAEKYYNDNVNTEKFPFANADAAYVFSFHMIMLATDLHNTAIRKKMTKQEWIKNNNTLNDGKDFSEDFLIEIYDNIGAHEIKTRDNPNQSYPTSDLLNPKQRQILFQKEGKMVVKQSQDLILEKLQKKSTFFKSNNIQHVKPMFEMCWCPMLAAFSVILETDMDDIKIFSLCLEGFRCAIRVSSIFYLETERNAFVTTLCQFTLLSNTREMKQKNIHAIKCLIVIAKENGNYLQESWHKVLNCISQLSKIHLIGSGAKSEFFVDNSPTPPETKSRRTNSASSENSKRHDKLYEELNASSIVDQISSSDIDKIYSNTINLNSNAIVNFVECLCGVSDMEVNLPEPRTFSLQKLVEIAYFNMERIRFVWSRIWLIMANHFVKISCHKNLNVAMYAVDSLRQLAIKFLEKDELANYNFQKDFLKPFELIITNNNAIQVRELVIRCVTQIILSKSENIKSGWKSMLMIFTFAANDTSEMITKLSFDMVHIIMEKYFPLIRSFFVECVNCLIAFAKSNHSKDICCKSIDSIEFCASQLAKGAITSSSPQSLENVNNNNNNSGEHTTGSHQDHIDVADLKFNDGDLHLRYWFPILTGLSQVVSHQNDDVRSYSLDKLYSLLTIHGPLFTTGLWKLIFRGVLLPIFDNVNYASDFSKEDNEWLGTTCLKALTYFVELFSLFFDRIQFLLIDFISLLCRCILTENENLATISCSCLLHFCLTNGSKWDPSIWFTFCYTFDYVISQNLCYELLFISKPHGATLDPTQLQPFPTLSDFNVDFESNFPNRDENGHEITPLPHNSSDNDADDQKNGNNEIRDQNENNNVEQINIGGGNDDDDDFKIPHHTLHRTLLRSTPKKRNPFDLKVIAGKCAVHLELISAIKQIFDEHHRIFEARHINLLLHSLYLTYSFAYAANNSRDIWKSSSSGIMNMVIKQEVQAASAYLHMLFVLYSTPQIDVDNIDQSWKTTLAEEKLIQIISTLIKDYLDVDEKVAEFPPSYFSSKVQAVNISLSGFLSLKDEQVCRILKLTTLNFSFSYDDHFSHFIISLKQFLRHFEQFYDFFAELFTVAEPTVRVYNKDIFLRFGKLKSVIM